MNSETNDFSVETKVRVNTKEATFNMFKENFSIQEIAMHRKLTVGTVQTHLIPFVANNEINISIDSETNVGTKVTVSLPLYISKS